jgi:hypothetical protein
MPLTLLAQEEREMIPVDWKEVKKVAEQDPQRIKNLVERMSAEKLDTTMTWQERILAFYGQSYIAPISDISEGMDLDKLMNEKKYEECLSSSKEVLKKNPLCIKALQLASYSIVYMLRDSTHHYDVSKEEGQIYYNRMFRIFNTMAKTGDGTKERPFYVTSVSDEYMFMRYYLDLWNISKQTLSDNCDVIELKETSKYYSNKEIYFEITRVLESYEQLFK